MQDSRGRLETEVRKVLHEVSRIAEEALVRAPKLKEEGEPVVEAELGRLTNWRESIRGGPMSGYIANTEPLAYEASPSAQLALPTFKNGRQQSCGWSPRTLSALP
jgi:hypothetical protein